MITNITVESSSLTQLAVQCDYDNHAPRTQEINRSVNLVHHQCKAQLPSEQSD